MEFAGPATFRRLEVEAYTNAVQRKGWADAVVAIRVARFSKDRTVHMWDMLPQSSFLPAEAELVGAVASYLEPI